MFILFCIMEIKIILERSNTGYSAYAENVDGIFTAGDTIEEIKENIKEVIGYQVEYLEEKGEKEKADNLRNAALKYYIDLNAFFEYYSLFNKSELAKYIGINPSHLRRLSMENMELSDQKAQQIEQGMKRLAQELSQYCFS